MIDWAVNRPRALLALCLAVGVMGAVAVTRLPLATRPRIELPRLAVTATWQGASAEAVESYVTSRLEAAAQTVRGVERVSSTSREGRAQLDVRLRERTDVRLARLELIEAIETIRPSFPPGVRPPQVGNYVPEELREPVFLQYSLVGPYTPGALARAAREHLIPGLSSVPGVAGVDVRGGGAPGVTISYDGARVRALGLRADDLRAAIAGSRIVVPAGAVRAGTIERSVTVRDQPAAAESLGSLPIPRATPGPVIRISDVAAVRLGDDEDGGFYRVNGRPAVTLTIARLAGANALRIAARVRARLAERATGLPPGVSLVKEMDESGPLGVELRRVTVRVAAASALVLLVLLAVYRQGRPVLLLLGSVGAALAATALALFLLRIPVNLLTLAGLGMGIGILVDNGLMVAERLRTRRAASVSERAAATREAAPAVLGTTLTTAVVLLPFLYLQGDAGAAFAPFAAAFAIALGCSIVTALTMVPAFAGSAPTSRRVRARGSHWHRAILVRLFRWRWPALTAFLAGVGWLGWAFTTKVPRFSFGRWWGEQTYLVARVGFPLGSNPILVDAAAREFERAAIGAPGVVRVGVQGAELGAVVRVDFTPTSAAGPEPYLLKEQLTALAVNIGGADVSVYGFGPGFSSGGYSSPTYSIRVLGYEYAGVERLTNALADQLRRIPRVREVDPNAGSSWWSRDRAREVVLEPDRGALARAGLTAGEFAEAVARQVAGPIGVIRVTFGAEEVPVVLKVQGAETRSLDELEQSLVTGAGGRAARVGALAQVGERRVLADIVREDQQYRRILTYEFRGPQKLGDRVYKSVLASAAPPPGYALLESRFWGGPVDESSATLWLVFGIAVALVLIATAAVYDSVWVTMMVFLSLPLAFAGVAGAFLAADAAFTREAAVGVILVVGLAVNQVIVLADLVRRRRQSRTGDVAAVLSGTREAAGVVLLTGVTTVASLVPLAWGTALDTLFGAIALATAGGTVASTLAALFIMPLLMVRPSPKRHVAR